MFYTELHGLRGLAVLLVCLFHFFEHWFPGGFRGVDVFFVLSGYLVTLSSFHSFSKVSAKEFLFGFYSRRFARIFPSLMVVSFLSLILALIFTIPTEANSVVMNYFTANLGLLNIRLFNEGLNYFNLEQGLNFFTQTWSLGVEEQFYLVFSVVFFLTISKLKQPSYFVFILALLCLFSFSLNFFNSDLSSRFYLLQFRYWEIGFGSLLYFIPLKRIQGNLFLDLLCILTLLANLFLTSQQEEFIVTTVITVLPVAYFILSKGSTTNFVRSALENKQLQLVATFSYTLYLVHWPISVFINYISGPNPLLGLGGLLLSLVISYFLYFHYEAKALLFFKKREKLSVICLCSYLLLCATGYYFAKNVRLSSIQIFPLIRSNQVENTIREYPCYSAAKKYKDPYQECLHRSQDENVVYLLGDSQSSALFPVFESIFGNRLKHIVLKATGGGHYDDIFAKFSHYGKIEKIKVFDYILNEAQEGDSIYITFSSKKTLLNSSEELDVIAKLWNKYFEQFKLKGVKIVFIKPIPIFNYRSVNTCAFHNDVLGNQHYCDAKKSELLKKRKNHDYFFSKLEGLSRSFDLYDLFCTEDVCSPYYQGAFVFADDNHLTFRGSLLLKEELMNLLELTNEKN